MDTNIGSRIYIANSILRYSEKSQTHKGNWARMDAEIGTIAGSSRLKGKSSILIRKTGFVKPTKILFGK